MADLSNLSDLVSGRSEDLGVEYKAWMDTRPAATRAKLARHIAALANHGGGFLIFGVDDTTRQPLGEKDVDRRSFRQDEIVGIVKKYLDPRPNILVEEAEHDGVKYPVVIVPSHEGRPIVAVADGPHVDGKPQGIRQGVVYVRAAGPQSVPISGPDQWIALIDRCLVHRVDLMGKMMRQALARPGKPAAQAGALLRAAVDATASDFSAQMRELAGLCAPEDRARVLASADAFCAMGYVLVGDDGEPVHLEGLRRLNERVAVSMRQVADNGWAWFKPLNHVDKAPQQRLGALLGEERAYLEGMRLPSKELVGMAFDYWRLYEAGIGVSVESYREDQARARNGETVPYLMVRQVLWRCHSLLAHARLLGQLVPGVQQVVVRTDCRGLAGRRLLWSLEELAAAGRVADDRFLKVVTLDWAVLRDSYFEALKSLALPLLDAFPTGGFADAGDWLTRDVVEREFRALNARNASLFND